MTTGERIKDARKKAGLTQKDLADRLGISYVGVSQWESGKRKPKIDTLERIAAAIGCDISALIENIEMRIVPKEGKELTFSLPCPPDSPYYFVPDFDNKNDAGIKQLNAEQMLIRLFRKLNYEGRYVAVERVEELTEIPKYQADKKEPAPE